MICPNCNSQNDDQAMFCSECGTALHSLGQTVPVPMSPSDFQNIGQTMSPQAPAMNYEPQAPAMGIEPQVPAMNIEPQEQLHAPLPSYQPAFQSSWEEEKTAPVPISAPVYLGAETESAQVPEKKQKKFLVPMVIFAVLFGLAAAGLGVGSYFFFKQKGDHERATAQLEDRLEERANKLEEQQGEIEELQSKNKTLEQSNSDLKGSLTTALQQRDEYQKQAEDAAKNVGDLTNQTILGEIATYPAGNEKFFATKNVVVLHKGESETIKVGFLSSGQFTVYWNSDNRLITPTWQQDWAYEGNLGICSITFLAGNTTGKTMITFTNNVNSETFKLVVYVID